MQGDSDGALFAYEQALRHNYQSIQALNAISCILRTKENFPRAVEYLQTILKLDQANGEVWGSLGNFITPTFREARTDGIRPLLPHDGRFATGLCSLSASIVPPSQPQSKWLVHSFPGAQTNLDQEPKLWYGIGILYDRYGSLEHAEEAFSQVMHMQPDFEKANEIYFRLGIIYKQQQKYEQSLDVSGSILARTNVR